MWCVSADERLKEQREAMAVVSSDGSVLWLPPAIYKSTCSIDITYFPFDIQRCHMKFGSWTYDGFQLDIGFTNNNASIDVTSYIESNEWNLLGCPARRNLIYYQGLVAPYPDLTFSIFLQRVPMFHKYILVLPCVLLSFLTLVIFWLPPESPAKVMLGRSVHHAVPLSLCLCQAFYRQLVGPIPWGHSGPLCHALSLLSLSSMLLWTSTRRRRATVAACDCSDT